MSERFFVESPISGDSATLSGQEAVHLNKVLRARLGDVVTLFDGSGTEFTARITDIKRDAIRCEILARHCIDRESENLLSLGVALPKGDRQRVLVEKLTELGVASLTPLITERSVVQPDSQSVVRLQRTVIEASKQCGRNRLMTVTLPSKLSNFFTAANPDSLRIIAHPAANGVGSLFREEFSHWKSSSPKKTPDLFQLHLTAAVGPEGGFTEDEIAQATAAGWQQVDLGPRILRVETAAIALASLAAIG